MLEKWPQADVIFPPLIPLFFGVKKSPFHLRKVVGDEMNGDDNLVIESVDGLPFYFWGKKENRVV